MGSDEGIDIQAIEAYEDQENSVELHEDDADDILLSPQIIADLHGYRRFTKGDDDLFPTIFI